MSEVDADLKSLVRSRARGCCEYCRISEIFTLAEREIDHVIALKYGGETTDHNLALCCTICNRFKGSDIASLDPESLRLTPLFHPPTDWWDEHFKLREGEIIALTAKGRVTVRLLRMNRPMRVRERQLLQGS